MYAAQWFLYFCPLAVCICAGVVPVAVDSEEELQTCDVSQLATRLQCCTDDVCHPQGIHLFYSVSKQRLRKEFTRCSSRTFRWEFNNKFLDKTETFHTLLEVYSTCSV